MFIYIQTTNCLNILDEKNEIIVCLHLYKTIEIACAILSSFKRDFFSSKLSNRLVFFCRLLFYNNFNELSKFYSASSLCA